MKDKTFQDIINAIDILASGSTQKSNGKISAVNLIKEAGICKATLYRYFETHIELKERFTAIKKNSGKIDSPLLNIYDENTTLKNEIKSLRSKMSEREQAYLLGNNQKAHQILILWEEINRLKNESERLLRAIESKEKINVFPQKE